MLIGINGVQGAGKDTLCDIIKEIYPETERRPEAEPVKEAAATFLKIDRKFVDEIKNDSNYRIVLEHKKTPSNHITDISMREFLRLVGHDGRRIFGEDIWINLNIGKLPRNFHWHRIVVITDVRYDNEAEVIHNYGGFIVYINRSDIERPNHGSEAGINEELIDYTINNDKGLEELRLATRVLLHDLQAGRERPSVLQVRNDLHLPMLEPSDEQRMH